MTTQYNIDILIKKKRIILHILYGHVHKDEIF